jgi:hypothetical protein
MSFTTLNAQTLYVAEKSGTQSSYLLKDINKMTFYQGYIFVKKNSGSSDNYSLANIRYLSFTDQTTYVPEIIPELTYSKIFPNPAEDVLNIRILPASLSTGSIEIFTMKGEKVQVEVIENRSDLVQINVSKLHKGFYVCKINNGKEIEFPKFFKQ